MPARGTPPSTKAGWLGSAVAIALILLGPAVLAAVLWGERESVSARGQLARSTEALAAAAATELARIRGMLELAGSDQAIRSAFATMAEGDLRVAQRMLAARLPDPIAVTLLSPNPPGSVDSMSYAGLDLAREAVEGLQVTGFECHRIGQPDMHLAVAAPVLNDSRARAVGVIHAAFPMSLLPALPTSPTDGPTPVYRQVVGDQTANLSQGAGPPDREPDATSDISGTRLQLAAWAPPFRPDPWMIGTIAAIYLAVCGIIAAILALSAQTLSRKLTRDARAFAATLDAPVSSKPGRTVRPESTGSHNPPAPEPRAQEAPAQKKEIQQKPAATRTLEASPARPETGPRAGMQSPRPMTSTVTPAPSASLSSEPRVEVEEIDLPESVEPLADLLGEDHSPGVARPPSPHLAPDPMAQSGALVASPDDALPDAALPPTEIFRAYDIRGVVDRQLNADVARAIGRAIGSEIRDLGETEAVIGRDCRTSSPALAAALTEGLRACGLDVVDLGIVPTPVVYFACNHPTTRSGAMITASHNPPDYNGVKPVLGGESPSAAGIAALRTRLLQGDLAEGRGGYREEDLREAYQSYVEQDVALARSLKLVLDCGNGSTSEIAPALFRRLDCEVIELNCEIDGGMEGQMADPSVPEQLRTLGEAVLAQDADLGLAFDGDGDRLGVVDSQGRFVAADRLLMLLATDVLARNPGSDVIFDVKCTRHLASEIRRAGGRPIMWRSGHAPMKAKLRESGALIAGELTGHLIFAERWFGFDDALYAGARLLELLALDPRPSAEVFASLPGGIATPELTLRMAEGEPAEVMNSVLPLADRLDGVQVVLIDGLRAEFDQGWGLVRASNTQPALSFRFEGDDERALEKIQGLFRKIMAKAAPGVELPF